MKNLNKLKKAPLYLIVKKTKSKKASSIRIFPLMKAIIKDGVWSYPGKTGRATVDTRDLNNIFEHNFKGINIQKSYCLKGFVEKVYDGMESSQVALKPATQTKKDVVLPVAKKAPVVLIVPTRQFKTIDMLDINAVNDILSGKTNSFSVIYKRYYNKINRDFMLGLKNDKDVADDLTMEFFIKVYEKIHMYKPDFTFNAWITSIAKNHLIDYFRKAKQSPQMISIDRGLTNNNNETLVNSIGNDVIISLKDEGCLNGEEMLINDEKKDALNKVIAQLDTKSREVMKMCLENKTYKEMSNETGISIGNIKARIFRAKERLREILDECKGLKAAIA